VTQQSFVLPLKIACSIITAMFKTAKLKDFHRTIGLTRIIQKIATKTQRHKERFLFEYSFVAWWQKYFAIKCKEFMLNYIKLI
jgi:hypothetical protein